MQHKKIKLSALLLSGLCLASLPAQTVKDIDGNVYKTVKIGNQIWMAENLKTTKYNDGKAISLVTDTTWHNITTAGYCWYNNNKATYKNFYGALYNWYTVKNGKLCPSGWHVPTDDEWTTLITYFGGEDIAAGKLKEAGASHWKSPNTGATNESGFTALPGGSRFDIDGSFYGIGDYGNWWSSTEIDSFNPGTAFCRIMDYRTGEVGKGLPYKRSGASVRCVLGSTVLTTTPDAAVSTANPKAIEQKEGNQVNASKQKPQELVTIRNEKYRFEVTAPESWSFRKIVQQDPYEEMKSGSYSSSISGGEGEKEPENWNGFKLISTDESNNSQPFVIIYGHKVSDQNPEEFAELFKRTLSSFSGEALSANWAFSVGDAKGFDCTYGLIAKVRYTALYRNGIRVVIMYYFPASDPSLFEKYAPEVDKLIKSLRIK